MHPEGEDNGSECLAPAVVWRIGGRGGEGEERWKVERSKLTGGQAAGRVKER